MLDLVHVKLSVFAEYVLLSCYCLGFSLILPLQSICRDIVLRNVSYPAQAYISKTLCCVEQSTEHCAVFWHDLSTLIYIPMITGKYETVMLCDVSVSIICSKQKQTRGLGGRGGIETD